MKMNFVRQSWEWIQKPNSEKILELAGRTCYNCVVFACNANGVIC